MQQTYTVEDESKEQIQKKKFLTLRVHHLSFYKIELNYLNKQPYSIDVNFVMENHHDTPSPERNKPQAMHCANIHMNKIFDISHISRVRCIRTNSFSINLQSKDCIYNPLTSSLMDTNEFNELFTHIEFCIDHILALNKDIKEYKEHRRSDKKHDKHTFVPVKKEFYKSKIKGLEKERSEAKKELRSILVGLYS